MSRKRRLEREREREDLFDMTVRLGSGIGFVNVASRAHYGAPQYVHTCLLEHRSHKGLFNQSSVMVAMRDTRAH